MGPLAFPIKETGALIGAAPAAYPLVGGMPMRKTELELRERFRSTGQEERRRLLQEKMSQYLMGRMAAPGEKDDLPPTLESYDSSIKI